MAKRSSRRRPTVAASTEQAPAREVDLAAEYQYVIEDLRRIGLIAAVLIGALVALSCIF